MKRSILNLGLILLAVLSLISAGGLVLFFNLESNNIYGMALGIIFFIMVVTFLSYLVYDLYSSIQDDHKYTHHSKKEQIRHYRGL